MLAYRSRLKVSILVLWLGACETSGQFESDKKKPDNGKKEESSSDQNADEPVMVGGAYLACAQVNPGQPQKNIGCALEERKLGQKYDLSTFQVLWQIRNQAGQVKNVPQQEGRTEDKFHRLFTYLDASYLQDSLAMTVSKNGRQYVYSKPLANLDPGLGEATFALGADDLPPANRISPADGSGGGVALPSCTTDAAGQVSCTFADSIVSLVSYLVNDSACDSGNINTNFVATHYGQNALQSTNSPTRLRKGSTPCIVKNDKVKPEKSGGCNIIPVLEPNPQGGMTTNGYKLYYYVFPDTAFGLPWNKVSQMVAPGQHVCAGM